MTKPTVHVYSPNRIHPWNYLDVFVRGIGGSETAAVEMAMRFARRGFEVFHYSDLPKDDPDFEPEWQGVHWRDLTDADLTEDGVWWVFRSPSTGAKCESTPTRKFYLFCEDVFYTDWSSEAVAHFDRIFALCPDHRDDMIRRDPTIVDRLFLSSNGVNVEAIEAAEAEAPERNPKRLIWTSSPDRGLKEVLDIFERAREMVPDLELAVFYGMDNIDKICGGDRTRMPWAESWAQYDRANAMPGVTWRGRIGQDQLKREMFGAGIWLYPTWFSETSCISCMEAQACGVIPITRPFWAVGHNVRFGGIFIDGEPNEPLVKARYTAAVVAVASNPEAQETVRAAMMPAARAFFDWENWVTQWEVYMALDMMDAVEVAA